MKNYSIFIASTSPFSFINPLQVEVASIGTVLKTFVLFLFTYKWACFFERKRTVNIVNPSFSFIFVQINNFYKFTLHCLKKASFLANHISFDSPKERVSKLASTLQKYLQENVQNFFIPSVIFNN